MTQEGEAPEGTEEEEGTEEGTEEEEAVDPAQELLAQVADPNAMTGTIDTSGAGAATVAEQLETITPTQMAESGNVEALQEVVDGAEEEGGEEAPAEEAPAEEEEEAEAEA